MAPFPFKIYVPPPLPPPLPPPPPPLPHLIPPLTPILPSPSPPLIPPAPLPSPPDLVEEEAEEEDDIVVEFHGQKWKKDVDEKKTETCSILPMGIENNIWCFFSGSPGTKSMARIDFFLEMLPINELNLILALINVELHKKIQQQQYG